MLRRTRRARALEAFGRLIGPIRATGRAHGYAVAVHGSLARDLDLVAVPWTPEAGSAEDLVAALLRTIADHNHGAAWIKFDPKADPLDFTKRSPEPKWHGRQAWAIYLGGPIYIDLSVMPRLADPFGAYRAELERLREAPDVYPLANP